ncbi:hypothetical protein [Streptomyces sp. WMMC1477]|uniref:hypothetical protein n=1 Tax=Streptomyces sp. WMMC1477 TaxID=3015155 RepID=UPI0022B61331|nr:hypothetical protein [Streptomyces sp. WMMC1477]MCZ7430142.1 hypothetical protein [Streptomyces sp. WMMC1477]
MRKNSNGDDFAQSLGMLHNTLTDMRGELRTSLREEFEGTRSAGEQAVRKAGEDVTAELGRMRTDVRNTQKAALTREDLADVQRTLDLLRDDVQRLRQTIGQPRAEEPEAPEPGPAAGEPAEAASESWPPPVTALVSEAASGPTEGQESPTEAGPTGEVMPRAGLPLASQIAELLMEKVTEAVVAALREELQPLHTGLAEQTQQQAAQQERAAAGAREQIAAWSEDAAAQAETCRQETREGLAGLREEIAALRRPPPAEEVHDQEETGTQQDQAGAREEQQDLGAHRELLRRAAQVSHAVLVCHRDTWEFLTGRAGRHDHFRMPAQISDHGQDRIAAAVSGRSLIAVLISLFNARHTAGEGDGDWALAATTYDRIATELADLTTEGGPIITITLDDRTPTTGAPAPDQEQEGTPTSLPAGEPDGTGGNPNTGVQPQEEASAEVGEPSPQT